MRGAQAPQTCPQRPLIFLVDKRDCLHVFWHLGNFFSRHFFIDGSGILYFIVNFSEQGEAAASAVCLGSHAARGDYGECASALLCSPAWWL